MSYPVSTAFWSASASWFASRKRAQEAAAKGGISKVARKAEQWAARGAHYMRGHGAITKWQGQQVTVDPKLGDIAAELLDRVAPALMAAYDDALGKLVFRAWRDWPVSTGLSKSLISLDYYVEGEQFVGSISVPAPYVFFIKGQPFRNLLANPLKAEIPKIAAAALAEVVRG